MTPVLDCSAEAECACATSATSARQAGERCARHPMYFLASCRGCQAAMHVRIGLVRELVGRA